MWKSVKTILGNKHCSTNVPKDINSTDLNICFSSVGNDICKSFKDKGKETPVYKGKGTKTELGNYRPISVIWHIPKIFEKCVHDHVLLRDL